MNVTIGQARSNGVAETRPQTSTHRPVKLDDPAAAREICRAERTRKIPDKDVRDRLVEDWGEGLIQAQEGGRAGTDRWLSTLQSRSPERASEIRRAIDAARIGPDASEEVVDPPEHPPWDEPLLSPETPAVPFPLDVFPPLLAELIRARALALNCPPDYLGVSALAVASMAMGRSIALRIKSGWTEFPSLYCTLVGPSGVGKSPPMRKMAGPLKRIAKDCRIRYREEKQREAEKPKDQQQPIARKRVLVDDATVESLGPILRDNPRGLGMIRDELTALVCGMNQYKAGGKGTDRQFYLSAYSGESWSIDRKNQEGEPVVVENPFLSILGGLVDAKLASLAEAKDRDDGFIERLLFAMPDPVEDRWHDVEIDEDLITGWSDAVQRLWDFEKTETEGELRPWFVQLSEPARAAFGAWYDLHCIERESLDFPSYLGGTWAKMKATCGRLALIVDRLAYAYDPTVDLGSETVSATSVRSAIQLIDYFKAHARRAHGLIHGAAGEDNEDARAIIKWIRRTGRATFSERDARSNFRSRFSQDAHALERASAWLTGRRCIRPIPQTTVGTKGGRPSTREYVVNPAILVDVPTVGRAP